jgi:hypothetical protein
MPYLAEIMRKKTKRKHWNLIDNVTHAIVGAAITQRDKLNQLRLLEYSALDAMTKGSGTIQDWRTLVDVLNLSEMMARGGVGPEVLPVCQKAQDSLHKAALRYEDTKKMGLDGQGIVAIRELIEYADLQQSSISRSEFEKFIKKTKNYIKSHGDKVVEIV